MFGSPAVYHGLWSTVALFYLETSQQYFHFGGCEILIQRNHFLKCLTFKKIWHSTAPLKPSITCVESSMAERVTGAKFSLKLTFVPYVGTLNSVLLWLMKMQKENILRLSPVLFLCISFYVDISSDIPLGVKMSTCSVVLGERSSTQRLGGRKIQAQQSRVPEGSISARQSYVLSLLFRSSHCLGQELGSRLQLPHLPSRCSRGLSGQEVVRNLAWNLERVLHQNFTKCPGIFVTSDLYSYIPLCGSQVLCLLASEVPCPLSSFLCSYLSLSHAASMMPGRGDSLYAYRPSVCTILGLQCPLSI